MSAFCPVDLVEMETLSTLCPHVAVIADPGGDSIVCVDGIPALSVQTSEIDLDVLTYIGDINGFAIFFSPNPKVYLDAILEARRTGYPVKVAYQGMWKVLGMEHEHWE